MSFDNQIRQAHSAQPELTADNFEINPQAPRNAGKATDEHSPVTAAEKTLRDALVATKANGGIPNESAIDLFREAMTTSEKTIQDSKTFLKDNSQLAGQFIDANQKLASVQGQMDMYERKDFAANMTAYLQGLVPKDKMETTLQNHYGKDYPNLVPAMQELYAAQHAPNAGAVQYMLGMVPRMLQDRVTTAQMYGAALAAEANNRPLGELGFMRQMGKP